MKHSNLTEAAGQLALIDADPDGISENRFPVMDFDVEDSHLISENPFTAMDFDVEDKELEPVDRHDPLHVMDFAPDLANTVDVPSFLPEFLDNEDISANKPIPVVYEPMSFDEPLTEHADSNFPTLNPLAPPVFETVIFDEDGKSCEFDTITM